MIMYSYDDVEKLLNECLGKMHGSPYDRDLSDLRREYKTTDNLDEREKIDNMIWVKDFVRQFEDKTKTETDFAASQQGFDGYIDHVKAALNLI